MNTVSREQLLESLTWRYATKQFDPTRKIQAEDWTALEQAVQLTPSSYGLQPWKMILVTDPAVRARLRPVSFGQAQVVDASHLVVFAVQTEISERDVDAFIEGISRARSVPRESLNAYRETMVGAIINGMDAPTREAWATNQAFIALGNFLNSAALLGIDACPMGGFLPGEFDKILGLDHRGLHAVVMVAAGYRSSSDKYANLKKVRPPKEQVLIEV